MKSRTVFECTQTVATNVPVVWGVCESASHSVDVPAPCRTPGGTRNQLCWMGIPIPYGEGEWGYILPAVLLKEGGKDFMNSLPTCFGYLF